MFPVGSAIDESVLLYAYLLALPHKLSAVTICDTYTVIQWQIHVLLNIYSLFSVSSKKFLGGCHYGKSVKHDCVLSGSRHEMGCPG